MGNFGGVLHVTGSSQRDTNDNTMKKVLLILAAVVLVSVTMTSCSNSHSCPAYGKVTKVPPDKRA